MITIDCEYILKRLAAIRRHTRNGGNEICGGNSTGLEQNLRMIEEEIIAIRRGHAITTEGV